MKLRQLRAFLAVADEGSFVAAGRALRLAQPAVSKQVAELERGLETPLFERGPRGARLTPAGDALAADARRILELRDRAIADTRAAAGWETGVLRLGRSDLMPRHEAALAAVLAALSERFPGMEIVSQPMTVGEQWRALEERRIAVGIGYGGSAGPGSVAHEPLAGVMAADAPGGMAKRPIDAPPLASGLGMWWRRDEVERPVLVFLEIARATLSAEPAPAAAAS